MYLAIVLMCNIVCGLIFSVVCVSAEVPKFTIQPSFQTVHLAQNAAFFCSATGYKVNYEWMIGSGSFSSKVTSTNTNILVIPDVRLSDNNTYTCTISNEGGSVTSDPAQLKVTGMSIVYFVCIATHAM